MAKKKGSKKPAAKKAAGKSSCFNRKTGKMKSKKRYCECRAKPGASWTTASGRKYKAHGGEWRAKTCSR